MERTKIIHMTNDSGHEYPHIDSYCGLGDSFDKGFEYGATDSGEVTCKKCLKILTIKEN